MKQTQRLNLPQVTICAATSVNVAATLRALETCVEQIEVAACKLFTDAIVQPFHPAIEVIPIERLPSSAAYSEFVLMKMVDHVATSHCLVVQWDGHIVDAKKWRDEFLNYDYIGARWPQYRDGHEVGNGGFSLRSKRLMLACQDPEFHQSHPEDTAICRVNRSLLEEKGMCFAPAAVADLFSSERTGDPAESFGYHGVFNMPRAIGVREFWRIYNTLDDLNTVNRDFFSIIKQLARGPKGFRRIIRMAINFAIGGRNDVDIKLDL